MASGKIRQTIQGSRGNSSDLKVDGALLQLMRVLVDIASNTSLACSPRLPQTGPTDAGDASGCTLMTAVSPQSRGDRTREGLGKDGRSVETRATAGELTESSVSHVRAGGD